LTADDARADGLNPLRPSAEANAQTGEPFAFMPQPLLAEGKVRYAGEPVALIVAETRAQALHAAEQVIVDYAPLPAVTTTAATRDNTARALGVPSAAVRFVAPDVGGGFGAKNFIYPEHVLILWAARRLGRAVKWIATRSEVFLADHQARDQQAEAALALDAEG